MKKSTILGFLVLASSLCYAQGMKIAFVYSDSILVSMPEYAEVTSQLETYENQLSAQLESKQTEFQQKFDAYQKNAGTWIPEILQDRQEELSRLDQNIREFQTKAQENLTKREQELMNPLYEKVEMAINSVAVEEGYDYVAARQIFLFAKGTHNVTKKVISKLAATN